MNTNRDKIRSAPPADALDQLATGVKNAPNHPTIRTWADVIRQGWPEFRELVLSRNYRARDVAGMLAEVFQREFDEDYVRRLMLAEAAARNDKKMLKALGKPLGSKAKLKAVNPERSAGETVSRGKDKAKEADKAAPQEVAQSEINFNGAGQSPALPEENGAGQSQIKERMRRMHGGD